MLKGALWMVSFKLVERGLGLVSTLILARLLMPADFGIVAMATSLIALLELFSAFGLDTALLQRKDPRPEHYNAAWSMNVLAGCVVGVLMVAIALPASPGWLRSSCCWACARQSRDWKMSVSSIFAATCSSIASSGIWPTRS
jgi:O-antigen/teichoic acid export membrane protein